MELFLRLTAADLQRNPIRCKILRSQLGVLFDMSRPARGTVRTDAPRRDPPDNRLREWGRVLTDSSGFTAKHAAKSCAAVAEFLTHSGGSLTRKAGREWLASLNASGSRKTAANKLSALRQWGEFLEAEGHIDRNPWAGIAVARGFRAPGWAPFKLEQVQALIRVAEKRENTPKRGTNTGPLASTWYALLALTGLRYSECRALKWAHVDLAAGTLTVRADKARRADTIPLATEAIAALEIWRAYARGRKWSRGDAPKRQKSGFIFPQAPSHHTLEADMAACGITKDAENKGQWHRFRKTAIAERAARGASVRDLYHFARHSDPTTTLKIYDRANVAQLRDVAELMPRLSGFLQKCVDHGSGAADTRGVKANQGSLMPTREQPTPSPATASRGLDNRAIGAGAGVGCSQDREPSPATREEWSRGELNPRLLDCLIQSHLGLLAALEGASRVRSQDLSALRPSN
jgi:integrase